MSPTVHELLVKRAVATCESPELTSAGRRAISRMLRYYATDPTKRTELGIIISGLMLLENKDAEGRKLISEILATATLSISDELCADAENMIKQDLDERHYQRFFEDHPVLLDPLAASIVPRQALAEMWKTDFVIRRFDDQYVFVELEKPRDNL